MCHSTLPANINRTQKPSKAGKGGSQNGYFEQNTICLRFSVFTLQERLFFKVLKLLRSFRIAFELFSREKINFCVELYSRRPFHFIPIYSTLETKRLTTLSISPRLPQFPIDIDLKTIHHIVMTHNTAISIFNICARQRRARTAD